MRKRPLVLGGFAALAMSWYGGEQLIWFNSRTVGEPQWRVATPADSVPQTVVEGEAHGARFPRITANSVFHPSTGLVRAGGTSERRCVAVGDSTDVETKSVDGARSGEFYAGPFTLYAQYWRQGVHPPPKLSWRGAHRARPGSWQLVLRIARIDSAGPSFIYEGPIRKVGRRYTYPYGLGDAAMFDLPSAGTWLFVATMAEEWGCFVFTLGKAR